MTVDVDSSSGIRFFFWSEAIEDEKPLKAAPRTPERMTANQGRRVGSGVTSSVKLEAAVTGFTAGERGGHAIQAPIAIQLITVKSRSLDLRIINL